MVKAGLEAIYLSGWQVAADANLAGQHVPRPEPLSRRTACPRSCSGSTTRCCAPTRSTGPRAGTARYWLAPIVADAEAGFGGPLNAFELMKRDDRGRRRRRALRGPARVGEEVRPPRRQGARADGAVHAHARPRRGSPPTCSTCRRCSSPAPTRCARRCSRATSTSATRRSSPASARAEGFFRVRDGLEPAIARGARLRAVRRPALVRDVDARPRRGARVRRGDPRAVPGQAARVQLLAVVQLAASTSTTTTIASFQEQLGELGYRFQFITLAGFHSLNAGDVRARPRLRATSGMTAYVELQEHEFALEEHGYTATRHQREVGAGYFDHVDAGRRRADVLDARARRARPRRRSSAQRERDRRLGDPHGGGARVRRAPPPRAEPDAGSSCSSGAASASATSTPASARLPAETREIREATGASRRRRPICRTAAVEITGPVERKMMINALNSGARVFMADFEDANSPTWENVVEGQRERARRRAARRSRSTPARRATG